LDHDSSIYSNTLYINKQIIISIIACIVVKKRYDENISIKIKRKVNKMAVSKKSRKVVDKLLTSFGVVATIALLVLGGLAWATYSFTTTNVRNELSAQKIYFPALGSPALASPQIGPYLNRYAGQQLTTGPQAKAYADHFIGVHLSEIAGGETYAQVSAKAMADPTNTTLKAQEALLFQGETLRGLLLGDAYAFWTVGMVAEIAAIVLFIAGGLMLILVLMGLGHIATS
jgi:hypothetical protein